MDIDIRIFGVQSRIRNIEINKEILHIADSNVFIDYKYDGIVPTAKRAWLYPTTSSHIMVLQDDVQLCNDFERICIEIISTHPHEIISLFPYQFQEKIITIDKMETPYVRTSILSGCGIIMPSCYVAKCISSFPSDAKQDDGSINNWATVNHVPVITTIPATIQHIGDTSVCNVNKAVRRTPYYEDNPVANWSSTKVYYRHEITR